MEKMALPSATETDTGEHLPASKSIIVFQRNDQNCYIYQQILEACFPNVPQSTVRRWLRNIGKSVKRTTSLERQHLSKLGLMPYRYLIQEDDLREVLQHSKTRRIYKKRNSQFSAEPVSTIVDTLSNPCMTSSQHDASVFLIDANSPSIISTTIRDLANMVELNASNSTTLNLGDMQQCRLDVNVSSNTVHSMNGSACNSPSVISATTNDDLGNTLELSASNSTFLDLGDMHEQVRLDENVSSNNVHSMHASTSASVISTTTTTTTNDDLGNTVVVDANSKVGCLPKEAMSPALKLSLDQLKNFYTVTVNPLRHCHQFCTSTANKFLERVSCFLNYCRIKGPHHELNFDLVNNFEIVQDYIHYQLNGRKLNISTVVRTLTALINLAKYVHRLCSNIETCIELTRLRNVQRQLSQEQRSYHLAVKAGLGGNDSANNFMFSHILETVRKLREKVDSSKGETGHMRILHDLVLLSLYLTSMCGRSKELRTLQLFHELKEGKTFHFDWKERCNVLVVSADERRMTIYENDFKTLRSHGPSKFEMDKSMWLIPYLKEYIAGRETILCGRTHPYMFATVTGLPFVSSSFTNYLARMFEREVNVRAGTTKLRHALVTHVMSLPESESLKLRESLASLMRHSMKHQQVTYCDISRQDRTSLSRALLNKSVEEATKIATESSTVATLDRNPVNSVEPSVCGEISVGDMVGLLDSVSTCAEDATVFVGRVMKIRGNETLLMEIRNISDTFYCAVVDSSWWESLDSLIYPIDIVFDGRKQLYELRSTAADIFRAVYPEQCMPRK